MQKRDNGILVFHQRKKNMFALIERYVESKEARKEAQRKNWEWEEKVLKALDGVLNATRFLPMNSYLDTGIDGYGIFKHEIGDVPAIYEGSREDAFEHFRVQSSFAVCLKRDKDSTSIHFTPDEWFGAPYTHHYAEGIIRMKKDGLLGEEVLQAATWIAEHSEQIQLSRKPENITMVAPSFPD